MKQDKWIGKKASGGKAYGILYRRPTALGVIDDTKGHGREERVRFDRAIAAAKEELFKEAEEIRQTIGAEAGEIFTVHALFLEDEDFLSAAHAALADTHTAEYALTMAKDTVMTMLRATGDPLIMARCDDIRDVAWRVGRHLSKEGEERLPERPFLWYAAEISPSEVGKLQKRGCVGIILEKGSAASHAAILANAFSLPMLVEVGTRTAVSGCEALLDAENAYLFLSPDQAALDEFAVWQEKQKERRERLASYRAMTFAYPSHRPFSVAANVGSAEEAILAMKEGASHIGLFRSELLFLSLDKEPSEDAQFETYRDVLTTAKKATIRLIDLGADKLPHWLTLEKEQNPALGQRGIRLFQSHPEMFKRQFRALLRASTYGELTILVPMVTSSEEMGLVRAALLDTESALREEGVTVGTWKLGAMIETPAAVMIADRLAPLCDSFSIGSNDLWQYTLAIDRENERAAKHGEPFPEALEKLIALTVKAAHEAAITVSLCGELGSDLDLTARLLASEIDTLSVSVNKILPIKETVYGLLGQ